MNLIQPRRFATAFGAIYLAVGLIGFALTGFDDPVATHGHLLVIFEVNPLHNAAHLAIGAILLGAAAATTRLLRIVVAAVGVTYGILGVVGLGLVGTDANLLALNHADNVLHLVTAAVAGLALWSTRHDIRSRRPVADSATTGR